MSFHDRYIDLIRRHLGRDPVPSDGAAETAIQRCERRLGVALPLAMREYYRIAGRIRSLNQAHNRLFGLSTLRTDGGYLWFMEENQAVVHWGIPLKSLSSNDPVVWQRANEDRAVWYSEKMRFSTFLIRMYDWQAGLADAPA